MAEGGRSGVCDKDVLPPVVTHRADWQGQATVWVCSDRARKGGLRGVGEERRAKFSREGWWWPRAAEGGGSRAESHWPKPGTLLASVPGRADSASIALLVAQPQLCVPLAHQISRGLDYVFHQSDISL